MPKSLFPLFAAVLLVFVPSSRAGSTKPNVVVIMADDIGLGDLSFYQRELGVPNVAVETPNVDRLIAEGMRFTDAHSPASLCAPTRFSMLTGNFSFRNIRPWGVWTPEADALIEPDFTTVARIAKAGGYHTAFFGKWGLGGVWTEKKPDYSRISAGARYYGFDYALELPQGIQNKPYAFYENQEWMKLEDDSRLIHIPFEQTGYAVKEKNRDRSGIGDSNWDPSLAGPNLARKAVSHIENLAAAHPGEAFFLYYCSQAVHVPHVPPAELDGVQVAGTTAHPHRDMIRELDLQVGMIVKALKRTKVYDNTLFVFTSDNGGTSAGGHDSSNGLHGKKGSIYEGGHRVPFVAVWPGKIKPGSESRETIVGQDMVATIARLAGQKLDRSKVKDSMNLLPVFTGQEIEERHSYLMHQSSAGPTFALRGGPWKLILGIKGENQGKKGEGPVLTDLEPVALFNLDSNLDEKDSENLVRNPEQSSRVERMMATYLELRAKGASTLSR